MTDDAIIERVASAAFFEYARELPLKGKPSPVELWNSLSKSQRERWRGTARAAIAAHTAALQEAGFAIVPREPTDEMVLDGRGKLYVDLWGGILADDIKDAYRAMIAAAPSPPSSRKPEESA